MKIMTNVLAALALTALVFGIANFFGDVAIPPQGPVVGPSTVDKTDVSTVDKTDVSTVDKTVAVETPPAPSTDGAVAASSTPTAPSGATAAPPSSPADLTAGDSVRGKKVFRKCIGCHSFAKGGRVRTGPNLWGIVGRAKASAEGFRYSLAFKALTGVWTPADINALITNPRDFASGTKMSFAGLKKPQDRADIIAFLSTLKD